MVEYNTFYSKGAKTKNNQYGLYQINNGRLLERPTVITLIPAVFGEKDLNGASKHTGYALGLVASKEQLENIEGQAPEFLSWEETGNIGVEFVSASVTGRGLALYEKYFKPVLCYENGLFKNFDDLCKTLRNINIISYCNSTKDVKNISELLKQDLIKIGKFNEKQIITLLSQVCAIDVTTRIEPGNCNFTTIHLFSKSDEDLFDVDYIQEQKTGITLFENTREANIIAEQMYQNGEDHDFRVFFDIAPSRTSNAQVMEVITGILVSNMVQSSMEQKVLGETPLSDLSVVFCDKNIMTFFTELLSQSNITSEQYQHSRKYLEYSRRFLAERGHCKEFFESLFVKNKNINDYFSLYRELKNKESLFLGYLDRYAKYKESDYFKKLTNYQKKIFQDVANDVKNRINLIQNNIKDLNALLIENCENNELGRQKIDEITKKTSMISADIKTNEIVKAYRGIVGFLEGKPGNYRTLDAYETMYNNELKRTFEERSR